MNFEIGKEYRTKDGRKVTIVEILSNCSYPIVGYIDSLNEKTYNWMKGGRFLEFNESNWDITSIENTLSDKITCEHNWKSVLLFSSTVENCNKCGVKKE